jgi:hypothetical protein
MDSLPIVDKVESVTLKETKVRTPIWAFELMLNWIEYLGVTLGIRFVYWGKASE